VNWCPPGQCPSQDCPELFLETQVRCPFLLVSVARHLVDAVLLGEIHTSFSIEESVISMLPSSLVMHRLVLRLLSGGGSLGSLGL